MQAAASETALPTTSARSRRELRIAEIRRRRSTVTAADPDLNAQTMNMVVNADSLWGPDEGWRGFVASADEDGTWPDDPSPSGGAGIADRHRLRRLLHRRGKRPAPPDSPTDVPHVDQRVQEEGVKDVPELDVPRAGRSLHRAGRGRSWVVRTAIVIGPLILVGGLTYSCGVHTGSERILQPSRVSDQDAVRFHLSTYPASAAAAFGVTYLAMCLTHPTDDLDRGNRVAALAGMTSAGVSPGCGWDGAGPAQQPISVSWTGTQAPAAGSYPAGVVEQLDFTAALPGDRVVGVSLPIWAAAAAGGPFLVVGDPAFLPAAIPTTAPVPVPPSAVDSSLAADITPTVLAPFLTAWAASDQVHLGLVLATDASPAASQGLNGQLANPTVDTAQAVVLKGDPTKGYRDGDLVSAQVTVTWQTLGVTQQTAYAIALRRTSGRWLVTDITTGAVDAAGGAAPNTAYPTTTPSASTSTTPPSDTTPDPTTRPTSGTSR